MSINRNGVRYNKEYFGFLVGFPDGKIIMTNDSAAPLLKSGASYESIAEHALDTIEIQQGFYLNTPPLVWLEITKHCNLKCPHCYIDGGAARDNELSTQGIIAVIDDLANMGVWAIAITGGEPTLHPDFPVFVQHARNRGLLVGIATHGLHLTDALLESLPKEGVIISISIDDLHVANKKDPQSEFNIASRALLRCIDHGFHANIMTNTNHKNIDQLDKIISWGEAHDVSVRSVPFSPIGERAKKYAHELENTPEDVHKAAKFWLKEMVWEHKYHEKVGLCVGLIFNYGLTLAYMSRRCSSGRFLAYICADGTVYPCTMCAGEKILSPGTLRDQPFSELWKQQWKIRERSWEDFKDTCEGCPLHNDSYYCSARCPAMSHARHGDFNSCGASSFEKVSLVVRTSMLDSFEKQQVGEITKPLIPISF
jgi:radical SAM protein with 4Fe4S-binding SPASM domain